MERFSARNYQEKIVPILSEAMECLDLKELTLIEGRLAETKTTFVMLGRQFGISHQGARKTYHRALRKLKEYICENHPWVSPALLNGLM